MVRMKTGIEREVDCLYGIDISGIKERWVINANRNIHDKFQAGIISKGLGEFLVKYVTEANAWGEAAIAFAENGLQDLAKSSMIKIEMLIGDSYDEIKSRKGDVSLVNILIELKNMYLNKIAQSVV